MKYLIILLLTILCAACGSTGEAYATMQELNNKTFDAAVARMCGPTAALAAERTLTSAEKKHRDALCDSWRTRMLHSGHVP